MRYVVLALLISVLVCGGFQVNSLAADKQGTASPEQVKQQAQQALETAKQYTMQEKEEYQKKIEAQLADLSKQIEGLKGKAKAAKQEMAAQLEAQLAEFKKQEQEVAKKLPELRSATSKAWGEVKGALDGAMDDLKKAYENARSQFE